MKIHFIFANSADPNEMPGGIQMLISIDTHTLMRKPYIDEKAQLSMAFRWQADGGRF